MKKIALLITCLILAVCFLPSASKADIVKQQQKIKHPTEALNNAQHTTILNAMRGKRTDAEKIDVLKESVKDKGITIDQLITLLNQFLTDDAKLECAQFAFPYTTNYKSFLRIMDLFSQESYKWKLEEFYRKNKK